jgi:heme-degrading monooxygenase HmoA
VASWKKPGRAIRVVIHEEEGVAHTYWRTEDEGNTSWRKEAPHPTAKKASTGDGLTTAELLEGIAASLQERRRASRGRKLRMPFR